MNTRPFLFVVTLVALALGTFESKAVTTATNRFYFTKSGTLLGLPYLSSKPLWVYDSTITRLLISIHSSDYNAYQYLNNGTGSAAKVPGASAETLVIAPHFLRTDYIEDPIDTEMLYWNIQPYWGSQQARRGPSAQSINISAFEALDIFLNQVVTNLWYPNLKNIVIVGHSAGGQFVNRYAAGNRFENDANLAPGLHVRYIVLAPSSYVYFDTQRAVAGTDNLFQTPSTNASAYNVYGYGLDSLYAYLTPTGASGMRSNYRNRFVFYMVGSLDTNPNDTSLDTGFAAMLQGSNRFDRARTYFNYVQHYFSPTILKTQHFTVVPNVGHTGWGLMSSSSGLRYLYDYDLNDSDCDGMSDWQEWISGASTTEGGLLLSIDGDPPALTWNAVTGRRYDVQKSSDLRSGFSTIFSTNGLIGPVRCPVSKDASGFFKLSVRLE